MNGIEICLLLIEEVCAHALILYHSPMSRKRSKTRDIEITVWDPSKCICLLAKELSDAIDELLL